MTEVTKLKRPKEVSGATPRVETGCGHLYVIVNKVDGKAFEVFARCGLSSSCIRCNTEAITRCISIGLRYGIPVEEFVHQLRGIQCEMPRPFSKENRVLSCPDGIAQVLQEESENSG